MKLLHVIKTKPDEVTEKLIALTSENEESTLYRLYEKDADYGALIDLVFSHDKVISWW